MENGKHRISKFIKGGLAASALAMLLSGCLGGSNTAAPAAAAPPALGGVAAVGFPIVGGTVDVSCAGGNALTVPPTDATGNWQVTLSGQTLPCAVRVSGGTINGANNATPYHSIATAPGKVNVTPLTDLMMANLVGADPAVWFAGLTPAQLSALTQTNVNTALANLRAALGGTLTPLATVDPITATFTPVPGNPVDDMLAAMQAALAGAAVPYANLLTSFQANNAPVVTPGGFNAALAANYTPPPVFAVTSVAPVSGAVGDTVTISGSGFDPFPLHNQVNFNGVAATVVTATATQLVVTVPAGATTGPITVRNIMANGGATLTAQGNFTVTAGGGGIACNTANYVAGAVRVPTANELTTFAKTYNAATGTIDPINFTFTQNGTATLGFGANGSLTYNGAPQTVTSICMDNAGSPMYVEFGTGSHIDLMADGSVFGSVTQGANTTILQPAAGGAGTWTLTVSGSMTVMGMPQAIPNVTVTGMPVAPTVNDVQTAVAATYAGIGAVTITPVANTATNKSFTVSFTGTLNGIPVTYNLTYNYVLV